ncbi:MAG: hypothetical protein HS100_08340 [Anaerolineales bacterium]|nr:hypothetical protein [Anaerolineales bacterium]
MFNPQLWLDFFNSQFWQNFLPNFASTLLGVVLGIPAALWINRFTEIKTKREKKNKILASLRNEIEYNLDTLNYLVDNEKNIILTDDLYGAMLMAEVWDTFSDGGELQWISDIELLGYLSITYGKIKEVKYLYDLYVHKSTFASQPQGPITERLWTSIHGAYLYSRESLERISKDKEIKRVLPPGLG